MNAATCESAHTENVGLTYQVALRALGQWLDAEKAVPGVRIVETLEGFVVQQPHVQSDCVDMERTVTFDEVWALHENKKGRKRSRDREGGYQNLLRAIGYELDEAHAHTILLEQVEEDWLLTYLYPHYVGGFALVKQFTLMAPDTRRAIVRTAQDRRSQGKLARGFSRLMGEA